VLAYRGIDIHELAVNSTFEETTYLLWNGILPNQLELREFQAQLALARSIDQRIVDMLRAFPTSATPMEVLRTAVSALSFYDADEKDNSHDANVRKSYNLTAQIAMLVAIYDRIRKGKEIVPPDARFPTPPTSCGCLTAKCLLKRPPARWIWRWSCTPITS